LNIFFVVNIKNLIFPYIRCDRTQNFPNTSLDILTVNYYGTYDFDRAGSGLPNAIGNVYNTPLTDNVKGLPTGSKVSVLDGTNSHWITTVNYYDKKGQAIHVYNHNSYLQTTDIISSKLDFVGKVEETKALHTNTNDITLGTQSVVDIFTYDHAGRLLTQKQHINAPVNKPPKNIQVIVENTYDELGQLTSKGVGGKTTQNRLQTVDYKYNIRGWLTDINQDTNNDNDLFNFSLKYNNPTSGTPLYNGNISQSSWNTINTDSSIKTYTYSYDALNRITGAVSDVSHYHLNNVSYDKNGNITALSRNGHTNVNATSFGLMDDLSYTYDSGNKLVKIADAAPIDQFGFKDDAVNTAADTSNDYTYDANGNMLTDTNKSITSITYNHLNLPLEVKFNNSNTQKINYIYDADGDKLQKKVTNGSNVTTTQYAEGYTYENNVLQFFNHPEGYVKNDNGTFNYVYQYKDYLGNIRLSYADSNNDGVITVSSDPNTNEIIQESSYYPFGLKHKGYNNVTSSLGNASAQKIGFGGKELSQELGIEWMDFGARNYDAALGRWMNLDPHANRNTSWTPYRYGYNNPIKFVDPDGKYERDGHYWTVYLAGMISGRNDSGSLAYWAEEPDHVMSAQGDVGFDTNTWMYPKNQRDWHALTGGSASNERARSRGMFNRASTSQHRGYALHRLGDSYAHSKSNGKMYSNGIGHAFKGHAPDKIANRPELYMQYVKDLVGTLGGDSNADLFAFDYISNSGGSTEQNSAVLETEIRLREGVKTFSVLGDQKKSIGDYMSARSKKYGKDTSYKTVTAEADSYKLNKKSGKWEKSGTETRTFVIFN
jgi:RHS repeat-associated protein